MRLPGAGCVVRVSRFDWMDDALCAEVGTEMFFPNSGENGTTNAAKKVCAKCTAKAPCLLFLVGFTDIHDTYGIAGGMASAGRRKVRRSLRAEQTESAA